MCKYTYASEIRTYIEFLFDLWYLVIGNQKQRDLNVKLYI